MATLRLLCVHGLGDHRTKPWKQEWEAAVRAAIGPREGLELEFDFFSYDDLFAQTDISAWEATVAVGKLLGSGISSLFRGGPQGARGAARGGGLAGGVGDSVRWSAGYVVAWTEDREFQRRTRKAFLAKLRTSKPHVIVAHSLGTLITYNALTHRDSKGDPELSGIVARASYVTLGSQIGNRFVVGNLTNGRVEPLDVAWWYHLYNREDDVFTAPIRLWDADNFSQVETSFDIAGYADHSAVEYLGHAATRAEVWEALAWRATQADGAKAVGGAPRPLLGRRSLAKKETAAVRIKKAAKIEPRRRALLIGINDYPNAADRLEGCVNDVFLMSSLLQEHGFDADDIRVCLDKRATAKGILERMEWLLDAPRAGDELVFYYSGHGAQLPTYGAGDAVDRMDETLVPWDFDWSQETCITDDQIYALYSQLPYGTRLLKIFDCCHSGGIHRAGAPRAKGLNPPDDIRHRELKWDAKTQMWISRDLDLGRRSLSFTKNVTERANYFGSSGATTRLGRGSSVRGLAASESAYADAKKAAGAKPVGPYLPVILEACAENEYAYEYRHGTISHGAFTYSLATTLRRNKKTTYRKLVGLVRAQLKELKYEQRPQILGPKSVLDQVIR